VIYYFAIEVVTNGDVVYRVQVPSNIFLVCVVVTMVNT
jgi:hypothetical protein